MLHAPKSLVEKRSKMARKTNQQMFDELAVAIDEIKSQLPTSPIKRNGELTAIKLQSN